MKKNAIEEYMKRPNMRSMQMQDTIDNLVRERDSLLDFCVKVCPPDPSTKARAKLTTLYCRESGEMFRTLMDKSRRDPCADCDRLISKFRDEAEHYRDVVVTAIDSLKSALFHLKQSTLDTEGTYGLRQVESTLLNLERRRGK